MRRAAQKRTFNPLHNEDPLSRQLFATSRNSNVLVVPVQILEPIAVLALGYVIELGLQTDAELLDDGHHVARVALGKIGSRLPKQEGVDVYSGANLGALHFDGNLGGRETGFWNWR